MPRAKNSSNIKSIEIIIIINTRFSAQTLTKLIKIVIMINEINTTFHHQLKAEQLKAALFFFHSHKHISKNTRHYNTFKNRVVLTHQKHEERHQN